MLSILVAEDDDNLRNLMIAVLLENGYGVFEAANGQQALDVMEEQKIDLLITDIMMPGMDGFQLVEMIRGVDQSLPMLVVTAKEEYKYKAQGFLLGVDDYMVKPLNLNEMLLRVHALLRRAKIMNERQIVMGEVVVDYDSLTVARGDERLQLPKKEFYLLYKLLAYPNIIFTRMQLLDEIWGMESDVGERTVDVHIKRLRNRFDDYPEFSIITVRGLGYMIERNE